MQSHAEILSVTWKYVIAIAKSIVLMCKAIELTFTMSITVFSFFLRLNTNSDNYMNNNELKSMTQQKITFWN